MRQVTQNFSTGGNLIKRTNRKYNIKKNWNEYFSRTLHSEHDKKYLQNISETLVRDIIISSEKSFVKNKKNLTSFTNNACITTSVNPLSCKEVSCDGSWFIKTVTTVIANRKKEYVRGIFFYEITSQWIFFVQIVLRYCKKCLQNFSETLVHVSSAKKFN